MGWFGPSTGDCSCCGCWPCDFPLGVDITWDTTIIDGCDCDFHGTTELREGNASRWFNDGLGSDPDAVLADCFARWDFAEVCCTEVYGNYDFAVLVYFVLVELYSTKAVEITVFSGRQTASISGGGTGDPCTKDWLLFQTSHGTGTPPSQTIDGWTMSGIKWATTRAPYQVAFGTCPTADENIARGTITQDHRPRNGFPIPLPITHCSTPLNVDLII